jgi:tetratricopeptide (TPR) repeat protein
MNELVIRSLLHNKLPRKELLQRMCEQILDPSLSWEDKRGFWYFLHNTGQFHVLAEMLRQSCENKARVPFDILIDICARGNLQPQGSIMEGLLKGMRKQKAFDDILSAKGWDKWDKRLSQLRNELVEKKVEDKRKFKENLLEKFWFLKNQRMTEQAGRVLKRMIDLYPEDPEFPKLKADFDEQWAREVLATHVATLQSEAIDRTRTQPSAADEEMLKCFMVEGEKIAVDQRQFAFDLAVAFWFMEDYARAMEILAWAPPGPATDWMTAEVLFASRRFVEALEQLNQLEIKYIEDPETTFAVSYLRAQCLYALGQHSSALEIMQSIVRVRAQYRSAHALILEWTSGASWE